MLLQLRKCGYTLQDVLAAAEARVDELRERLEDERQEVAASSATLAVATEQAQAGLKHASRLTCCTQLLAKPLSSRLQSIMRYDTWKRCA